MNILYNIKVFIRIDHLLSLHYTAHTIYIIFKYKIKEKLLSPIESTIMFFVYEHNLQHTA